MPLAACGSCGAHARAGAHVALSCPRVPLLTSPQAASRFAAHWGFEPLARTSFEWAPVEAR